MTLYNHFKSKDELILASLELQDDQWCEWKGPADRLLAMFDALEESFQEEDFCGCPFIKATSEYPDLNDPTHQIAVKH